MGNGRYLVGYTFTLPEPDVRALLKKDPDAPLIFLPCSRHLPMVDVAKGSDVLGWWWEVVPQREARACGQRCPSESQRIRPHLDREAMLG